MHEIERRENIEQKLRKDQRARAIDNMKERLFARLRRESAGNIEKTIINGVAEAPPLQTPDRPLDLCRKYLWHLLILFSFQITQFQVTSKIIQ